MFNKNLMNDESMMPGGGSRFSAGVASFFGTVAYRLTIAINTSRWVMSVANKIVEVSGDLDVSRRVTRDVVHLML